MRRNYIQLFLSHMCIAQNEPLIDMNDMNNMEASELFENKPSRSRRG